jgi:hypothetical protein
MDNNNRYSELANRTQRVLRMTGRTIAEASNIPSNWRFIIGIAGGNEQNDSS